jgi:Uma2 family endonuclease
MTAETLVGKAIELAAATLPRRKFTREEYYRLAEAGILREEERTELIEGEIVTMVPIGPEHVAQTTELRERIQRLFGKGYHVREQSPLALDESEPMPDLAVVKGKPADYKHAHPTYAVLVIEVAQSSLPYDRTVKTSLYAKAGIPEYWIVDLEHRQLEVYREPIESPNSVFGYTYRLRMQLQPSDTIAPLERPTRTVRVGRLFVV